MMLVTWPTTLKVPHKSHILLVWCANVTPWCLKRRLLTRRDMWRVWHWWAGGRVSAHRKAKLWAINNVMSVTSPPSCRIITGMKIFTTPGMNYIFPWWNVKHAGALPPTASNRSSHITLWTLPWRSNDQDIWIWGKMMEVITFLDLLTTLTLVQTW